MFSKILALLALFTYTNLVVRGCPYGWIQGIDSTTCYFLSNNSLTWLSAEADCVRQGGHLTSIESAFVNTLVMNGVWPYWIGGSNLYGGFQWSDGTNFKFTNWNAGQPNNTSGSACVVVQKNGKWDTQSCTSTSRYVCKLSLKNEACISCDDGWTLSTITNKCYNQVFNATSISNAQAMCQQYNADLVSIHSFLENQVVADVNNKLHPGYGTWIGLLCINGTCSWADGTPFDYMGMFSNGTTPFDPNNNKNCVIMVGNGDCDGSYEEWNMLECSYIALVQGWPFLCQKDPTTGNTMKRKMPALLRSGARKN